MSAFGGDSWSREAQYRKRRVDDLIIQGIDASAYKKLPSGKFLCLICPSRPVLDTPLTLSAHLKGARHQAAVVKQKERELTRENELKKRKALADSSATSTSGSTAPRQRCRSAKKPLIEQAQKKAASQLLCSGSSLYAMPHESADVRSNACDYTCNLSTQNNCFTEGEKAPDEMLHHQPDSRECRERELKFTAAGWKRDGYGRWFKDENVEFDSDEEDPNVCL